jgi:hypothetical protein
MSGAIHPLPQYAFMAWCLVKHRDNFTFTFFTILFAFVPSLNPRNARYHSVQNLLSSRLISKNLKIKIYKTVILPVVLSL